MGLGTANNSDMIELPQLFSIAGVEVRGCRHRYWDSGDVVYRYIPFIVYHNGKKWLLHLQ